MANNIFTSSRIPSKRGDTPLDFLPFVDRGKMDRYTAKDLDTYRNWGAFQLLLEPAQDDTPDGVPTPGLGVRSIFNNSAATYFSDLIRYGNNMPMFDTPQGRIQQRINTDCSIKALVEASEEGKMGRAIYSYADFAYCKYLGRMPNNYLVTLRRFPVPCGNHISYTGEPPTEREKHMQDHTPDIGRLVTWMGTPGNEMSNILKYSVKMEYKEMKADWEDVSAQGDATSPMAQLFNAADPAYQKQVQQGYAGSGFTGGWVDKAFDSTIGGAVGAVTGSKLGDAGGSPYSNMLGWRDTKNKVYGPVDVLKKTFIRDQGLTFSHEISLTFDYELRSYDGINGKAAMMDLLGNILAVTFTNGKFWGGGYRGTNAHQSNLFANLPIFKLADSGGLGDSTAVLNAFSDSLSEIGDDLKKKGGGSTIGGIIETIKGMGGMLLGGVLNKLGRPQKFTAASLLSPAPTGLWHLTVGNPRAPIIEVGNLILDSAEIEHYGPLGIDDFPTGLRVVVKLKHGKDKDNAQIEQMYLRGDNRVYVPMSSEIMKMYDNATDLGAARKKLGQRKVALKAKNSMKADGIDRVAAPTNQKVLSIQEADSDSRTQKVLEKYFGTTSNKTITIAGQESAWGSVEDKPKN